MAKEQKQNRKIPIESLSVAHLAFSFKRKRILQDVNFTISKGNYALLAPNGAGKTTLLRCLSLLFPQAQSALRVNGREVKKHKDYFDYLGYLPQQFNIYPQLTLRQGLELVSSYKCLPKESLSQEIHRVTELVHLEDCLDQKLATFSGGMMRRVGIAQTFLGDPDILLFDEPTAGLDIEERTRFKSIIAQLSGKKIILMSTHLVEDVETTCPNILLIRSGQVLGPLSQEEIKERAQGLVYQVKEEEQSALQSPYLVIRQFRRKQTLYSRVLSAQSQNIPSASPELEDGYLCIIKNIPS